MKTKEKQGETKKNYFINFWGPQKINKINKINYF